MKRLLWVLPAVLLLAACSGAGSTTSSPGGQFTTTAGRTSGGPADAAVTAGKPAVGAPPQGGDTANGVPVPQAFDPTRSVVLTANISMKARDPWAAADAAQGVATGLGGDVIGLNESGSQDNRSASLTIRVPSQQFTEALRRLRALDVEVVSSTVNGQDVSDQFVDLKARLSAKQAEEQRYLALLARPDNKVDDILKIDAVLGSVRTQIEQLQGQVNSIDKRTQFSTITVAINPTIVVVTPTASSWDPAKTVALALATLAAVLRAFADVAIWVLVFAWIPLIGLAVALVARGRRQVRPAA